MKLSRTSHFCPDQAQKNAQLFADNFEEGVVLHFLLVGVSFLPPKQDPEHSGYQTWLKNLLFCKCFPHF